jgi:hypothetical protein
VQSKQAWETTDLPGIVRLGLLIVCMISLIAILVSSAIMYGLSHQLRDGSMTQEEYTQVVLIGGSVVLLGIILIYFLFPLSRSTDSFTPSYGLVIPTELQKPFEVQFRRYFWGRSMRGTGVVKFAPDGLRVIGYQEPSAWFQLAIFLTVSVIPLLIWGVAWGTLGGLALAYRLGRKEVDLMIPYSLLNQPELNGRILRLTNEQTPKKISFAVARSDGERLYNEIERRYPSLVLTQIG